MEDALRDPKNIGGNNYGLNPYSDGRCSKRQERKTAKHFRFPS